MCSNAGSCCKAREETRTWSRARRFIERRGGTRDASTGNGLWAWAGLRDSTSVSPGTDTKPEILQLSTYPNTRIHGQGRVAWEAYKRGVFIHL